VPLTGVGDAVGAHEADGVGRDGVGDVGGEDREEEEEDPGGVGAPEDDYVCDDGVGRVWGWLLRRACWCGCWGWCFGGRCLNARALLLCWVLLLWLLLWLWHLRDSGARR